MENRIAVLGANGFVGSAVAQEFRGHELHKVQIARIATRARSLEQLLECAAADSRIGDLTCAFRGVDTVINCAGLGNASSANANALYGANALLPGVIVSAAIQAGVRRLIHVSSAAVQSDRAVLDESEAMKPFSTYSASKVAGESVLRALSGNGTNVVRFRPPGVHAASRSVTRLIRRVACSPIASVASPGDQMSPQSLLPNVAAAVAFLATCEQTPPPVVVHPSEGVTTSGLMRLLSGGAEPQLLPIWFARSVVESAKRVGSIHPNTSANARRLELLWFGQSQCSGWLTSQGFQLPIGMGGWEALAQDR